MVTPQIEASEIAKELGLEKLYLKREDLHPYGSHKGRSIPFMIDSIGGENFVISSSGNAALAAVRHIQMLNKNGHNIKLSILLGSHVNKEKKATLLSEIQDKNIIVEESSRPLQTLFRIIKSGHAVSLRQSTDDRALMGYQPLAAEILTTPDLEAVFLPASSGTTAEAIAEFFIEKKSPVSVHMVQTDAVSPLAQEFDHIADRSRVDGMEPSLADAIIDKVARRKTSLVRAIKKVNGSGWIVSNSDIKEAQKLLSERCGLEISGNGALGLAGLVRATRNGHKFKGAVVVIITGK